jgi:hypothetical protein
MLAQPSPTRRNPQPQPESLCQQQQLAEELTFGHCSDQPRQSSVFALTAESMMSADIPACSIFISLCSHHTFPQACPAFRKMEVVFTDVLCPLRVLHIIAI